MIISWQTQLTHSIRVNIENAENMNQDQLRQAIIDQDADVVSIESPCDKEII